MLVWSEQHSLFTPH